MKLSEILDNLQQPIPPNFISQKPAKNKKTGEISSIPYVAWFDLCTLLDCRCGLARWSWQIKGVQQVGKRLILTGVLTVYGEDRSLTREATGCEDVDCTSYGDPSSNAEAMALRRCCAKFGLGRQLWLKKKRSPQLPQIKAPRTVQPLPPGQISHEQWLQRQHH
jgi:hypothetical protein